MGISHLLNIVKKKKKIYIYIWPQVRTTTNCWHFSHGILPMTCYEVINFSWCLRNHLYYPERTSVTSVCAFKLSFLD